MARNRQRAGAGRRRCGRNRWARSSRYSNRGICERAHPIPPTGARPSSRSPIISAIGWSAAERPGRTGCSRPCKRGLTAPEQTPARGCRRNCSNACSTHPPSHHKRTHHDRHDARPNTALIVIDLQKGSSPIRPCTPSAKSWRTPRALADAFRQRGLPVVLVNVAGGAPGRTEQPRPGGPFPEGWTDLIPEMDRQAVATMS